MTITITKDTQGGLRLTSIVPLEAAIHLTKEATEDVAEAISKEASEQAPMGETGALKAHPVDISESRFGTVEASTGRFRHPAGSPGGIGGRFAAAGPIGQTIVRVNISLPEEPKYAKWVHDGTGIYGRHHTPIIPHNPEGKLYFRDKRGKSVFVKSVKGQKANPYLENAFVIIERTYLPARVEELRLEIRAL